MTNARRAQSIRVDPFTFTVNPYTRLAVMSSLPVLSTRRILNILRKLAEQNSRGNACYGW